jgi:hypothetical protein
MGIRIASRTAVVPSTRIPRTESPDEGYFYPGEVVRMIGLEGADYRQLRTLFRLARASIDLPLPAPADGNAKWSRFTLTDISRILVLVELTGGRKVVNREIKGRLYFDGIQEACRQLRDLGFTDPLLQVPMRRRGRSVVAIVEDVLIDMNTGQTLFDTAESLVAENLARSRDNEAVLAAIRNERAAMENAIRPNGALPSEIGLWEPSAREMM